ncbi:hypothetical protein BH09SUM1_BH09SUM1_25550 [soil metagenome]
MMYDPLAHYALDVADNKLRYEELEQRQLMAIHQFAAWGNAQPFASAIAFEELAKMSAWQSTKSFFRKLVGKERDADVRSYYETELGVTLPVPDAALGEMMAEVKKYKWIEAERLGRDIWAERNPADPEVIALREWFGLHFGAWYLSKQRIAKV